MHKKVPGAMKHSTTIPTLNLSEGRRFELSFAIGVPNQKSIKTKSIQECVPKIKDLSRAAISLS